MRVYCIIYIKIPDKVEIYRNFRITCCALRVTDEHDRPDRLE